MIDHLDKVKEGEMPTHNSPIHIVSGIMKNVMASAAEAETGASFTCGQEGCPIRTTLEELGHKQPPTPIYTDNETSKGILAGTIKQRRSNAIDMRFYWLQDRIKQGQYTIHWRRGDQNLADYHTKHHPPQHHKKMRSTYLHEPESDMLPG